MALERVTAAVLAPRFLAEANVVGQRFGPQAGLEYFFWRITPDGIAQFLRQNGYAWVANLGAAVSGDVSRIIRTPWVLQAVKSNRDAIFLYGPGFTPDVYDRVVQQIQSLPGTRGSRIDLVNTARLAGLSPQFVFMMQVVTNPGAAGARALGVSPTTTYPALGNQFVRQLMPGLPPNLFGAGVGANVAVGRLFGGPVS